MSTTQPHPARSLDEKHAPGDPLVLFDHWFQDASNAGIALPESMTLATTTPEGKPSARVVLLKAVEDGGFVFYTNYESRKGKELAAAPHAALVFHWAPLERQVRVEGRVTQVSEETSDAYFATRPLGSRHSALASPQSSVVSNRAWLEEQVKSIVARYGHEVVALAGTEKPAMPLLSERKPCSPASATSDYSVSFPIPSPLAESDPTS